MSVGQVASDGLSVEPGDPGAEWPTPHTSLCGGSDAFADSTERFEWVDGRSTFGNPYRLFISLHSYPI